MSDNSRLERVIIASVVSTSGAWRIILAQHIVKGRFCYDVLGQRTTDGEILCRHYNDHRNSDEANRAEALRYYDEISKKMTAPAGNEEKDEPKQPFRIIQPN